ncbi:hypothetical protein [Nitrosopumilus sp. b1]|uniref:hypothetical protein n=1 Tax=Nitrosopumilus sp. b1 TaxID=2109907 RepID=UPI0021040D86|nr:hypothetical protein [Nitrosopumilus sp. b1]
MIFLAIPLARIIPRVLSKRKSRVDSSQEFPIQPPTSSKYVRNTQEQFTKEDTKNRLVLGEINRGSKTFEKIQKNTGLGNKELDSILQDLENDGMLRVEQKQGMFRPKIELYATEKGFKAYYS